MLNDHSCYSSVQSSHQEGHKDVLFPFHITRNWENAVTLTQHVVWENGCRYWHPTEACISSKCKDKICPFRHPKKCKYDTTFRFQTKCMYKHAKKESSNSLTEDILALKEDISKYKKGKNPR